MKGEPMEKSRAIELLEHLAWDKDIDRNPYGDALNIAIEALKAQLSQEDTTSDQPVATDTNVGDAISRQAAIDALQKCRKHCIDPFDSYHIDIQDAENQLSKVPTVQPERKKGEWIVHLYKVGVSRYECDACHARCDIIYPYCPYCGEKKEGERDATN